MDLKNMSTLLQRSRFMRQLGFQFGTKRDIYTILGYQQNLTFTDLFGRYCRQDIAKRVVEAPAAATWQRPPIISENDDPNDVTEFEQKFNKLAISSKLWHYLERADKIAGIGQFGVLVIGGSGKSDMPLSSSDLLYLSTFHQGSTKINSLDTDAASPRFGLPKDYNIDLLTSVASGPSTSNTTLAKFHHSRIIHIAESLVEDELFGIPRLQPVYNLFDDLQKIVGGAAEMFWAGADRGMQIDIDKDLELDADDETALSDEIEEWYHGLRRYIRTKGVELNNLGGTPVDPRGAFSIVISSISGATGIPQRILLGSERGQLASSTDERNWLSRVKERQEKFAEPLILRPVIDTFIKMDLLPDVEYKVKWPDLMALSESEQAEVADKIANAIKKVSEQPIVVVHASEFREKWLGLTSDKSLDREPNTPLPTPVIEEEDDENENEPIPNVAFALHTGFTNGHNHGYNRNDPVTEEVEGHTHNILFNINGGVMIEASDGHSHENTDGAI